MFKAWKRKVELIAGGRRFKNDEFEIDFMVQFDDDDEPDISLVDIYNLSDETITAIEREQNIILNAGYEGDVGTILQGTIEKCETYWENVDKITRLTIIEGAEQWLNEYVSKTYAPGLTSKAILQDLVGQFGMELGMIKLERDITFPRGRSVAGMLQDVIREIVAETGSKFFISHGKIYIRPWDEGSETGVLLTADTGLLKSPVPFQEQDYHGYDVSMLLNHRVTVDSIVQIESKTANGAFRVRKGTHFGDFTSEIEVVG